MSELFAHGYLVFRPLLHVSFKEKEQHSQIVSGQRYAYKGKSKLMVAKS